MHAKESRNSLNTVCSPLQTGDVLDVCQCCDIITHQQDVMESSCVLVYLYS